MVKSYAIWPEGCLVRKSTDEHESIETAINVVRLLIKEGFGGEGKFFPVEAGLISEERGWACIDKDGVISTDASGLNRYRTKELSRALIMPRAIDSFRSEIVKTTKVVLYELGKRR